MSINSHIGGRLVVVSQATELHFSAILFETSFQQLPAIENSGQLWGCFCLNQL